MTDKPASQKAGSERRQRLGAALRANLKRRKAQARGRNDEMPAGDADDTTISDDAGSVRDTR